MDSTDTHIYRHYAQIDRNPDMDTIHTDKTETQTKYTHR